MDAARVQNNSWPLANFDHFSKWPIKFMKNWKNGQPFQNFLFCTLDACLSNTTNLALFTDPAMELHRQAFCLNFHDQMKMGPALT